MKANWTDLSLFKRYLEEKTTLMPTSMRTYIDSINRFLSQNPDIFNLNDYNDFIIKYAIKGRCGHYYSALIKYIEFKIDDGKIRSYLLEGLQRPPERRDTIRERRHLTDNQLLEVIMYLQSGKHQIVALIMKLTGVRITEVLTLKRDDVITEEYEGHEITKMVMTGKRGRRKAIFIHPDDVQKVIWDYISTCRAYGDYYFLNLGKHKKRPGSPNNISRFAQMNYQWFWIDLKQALSTAGIRKEDFSAHDFRRCFARKLWAKDKDLYKLQNALHHADPKTTLRYLDQSGLRNIDTYKEMQEDDNDDKKDKEK